MTNKYLTHIPYLEGSDFNKDGSLKPHVTLGKPVIVMCQGLFCGYCTQVKPDFQKLNDMGVVCATIQIDGKGQGDIEATKMLYNLVPDLPGVPCYLLYNSNGSYERVHTGARDVDTLKNLVEKLK